MNQRNEEWLFLQLRAAQLYDEGDLDAALMLMRRINRCQAALFAENEAEYEQTENC
ncbi:MAG: hypothetical protein J6K55_01050 [Clostridia bacterium]|nr:hypothetical protein [Clostridia bacterium]